jgi:hypothetical protein
MSQLADFVKARNINNAISGTVAKTYDDNPTLIDVEIRGFGSVTLPMTEAFNFALGAPVAVTFPDGDPKRAYVSGPSANLFAEKTFNRVVESGQG